MKHLLKSAGRQLAKVGSAIRHTRNKIDPNISPNLVLFSNYVGSIRSNETDNGDNQAIQRLVDDQTFNWHTQMPHGSYRDFQAIELLVHMVNAGHPAATAALPQLIDKNVNWFVRRIPSRYSPFEQILSAASEQQEALDFVLALNQKNALNWNDSISFPHKTEGAILCVVMQALVNNLTLSDEMMGTLAKLPNLNWGARTNQFTEAVHPQQQTALFLLLKAVLTADKPPLLLLEAVAQRDDIDWLQTDTLLHSIDCEKYVTDDSPGKIYNRWRPLTLLCEAAAKHPEAQVALSHVLVKFHDSDPGFRHRCKQVFSAFTSEFVADIYHAFASEINTALNASREPTHLLLEATDILAGYACKNGVLSAQSDMIQLYTRLERTTDRARWENLLPREYTDTNALLQKLHKMEASITPLTTHHHSSDSLEYKARAVSKSNNALRRKQIWDTFKQAMTITDPKEQEFIEGSRRELAGMYIFNKSFGKNSLKPDDIIGRMDQNQIQPDMAKAHLDSRRKTYLAEKRLSKYQRH